MMGNNISKTQITYHVLINHWKLHQCKTMSTSSACVCS